MRKKDSKTLVLVALLPTFLDKEKSRPPEAKQIKKRYLRLLAASGGKEGGKA